MHSIQYFSNDLNYAVIAISKHRCYTQPIHHQSDRRFAMRSGGLLDVRILYYMGIWVTHDGSDVVCRYFLLAVKSLDFMEGKRSKIWQFFSKETENKAKCDICQCSYSIKGGSTTNLKKHLMTKHRPSYDSVFSLKPSTCISNQPSQQPVNLPECSQFQASSNEPKRKKEAQQTDIALFTRKPLSAAREKKINHLILKLIIKDLQPFSIVEDSGFIELINYLEPNYPIPSRYMLSSGLLDAQFTLVKEKLKDELKRASHICLTTDGWTSRATTSYQAVTAHYILGDIWEMRSALLGCFECQERHTADYIKQELIHLVTDWEINDKIFVCVTDNASNMKAAIRLTGWEHFPCVAHTYNLIVQASLQTIQEPIKKVKCIVEYFHRSSIATKKLYAVQEQLKPGQKPLKLIMDVITRWNSTLDMLERVANLQEPIEAAIGLLHNPVENLSENEWRILPEVVKILKPFKQLTEEFSSENEVTISKILAGNSSVLRILNNLNNTLTCDLSKQLVSKLKAEFNIRFKNSSRHQVLSKSAILDPRFKRQAFADDSCYEYAKNSVREELERMMAKPSFVNESESEDTDSPMFDEQQDSIWLEFDRRTTTMSTTASKTSAITFLFLSQLIYNYINIHCNLVMQPSNESNE
ncbi:unnamed protein product [Acanthoscelides obtectus]|uniref:BED-type domain-containing protein n=1 Tax=Acanthoscelides obtectus TaxID=200917 RepID=A0A9P0M8B5_ACAOB|nr:unnamed protein product [Acanthoscelides obtectus]CAK1658525.1 Zinc finger BED domain-containing protein 1 [Acanthoscelides obtectus]